MECQCHKSVIRTIFLICLHMLILFTLSSNKYSFLFHLQSYLYDNYVYICPSTIVSRVNQSEAM